MPITSIFFQSSRPAGTHIVGVVMCRRADVGDIGLARRDGIGDPHRIAPGIRLTDSQGFAFTGKRELARVIMVTILVDDPANRRRIKAARNPIQHHLRHRGLAFFGARYGLRSKSPPQGSVSRPRPGPDQSRPHNSAGRSESGSGWRFAPPRFSAGWIERQPRRDAIRPGLASPKPKTAARGTAGVAPWISRSLIASGRIVMTEPPCCGEAAASECAVVGISPSGQGSKFSTLSGPAKSPSAGENAPLGRESS